MNFLNLQFIGIKVCGQREKGFEEKPYKEDVQKVTWIQMYKDWTNIQVRENKARKPGVDTGNSGYFVCVAFMKSSGQ